MCGWAEAPSPQLQQLPLAGAASALAGWPLAAARHAWMQPAELKEARAAVRLTAPASQPAGPSEPRPGDPPAMP